ncbi:MAG TPA: UDP-2,3-diacylglucosamine diphosphatase [Elusimicrobiota bacterium]|nr:UDP-2,3-diacylglucosamine diphosphatase [Elusimicrobiota bacterium]
MKHRDPLPPGDEPRRWRTIWISDIHLGTRDCKSAFLLEFLKHNESDTLYLVGDIIDGWRLKTSWHYWDQRQNDVVQKILRKARRGARVILVPGNHDEAFRDFGGMHFGGVEVALEAVHETAAGKRLLVVHGDQFDGIVRHAKALALLGTWAYDVALRVNHWFNLGRRLIGLPYWSLSACLKHKVKNAVEFIAKFEDEMIAETKRRGLDGVICGHIHHAEIRESGGVLYCNDGDWVESCTALAEDFEGRLSIMRWADERLKLGQEAVS